MSGKKDDQDGPNDDLFKNIPVSSPLTVLPVDAPSEHGQKEPRFDRLPIRTEITVLGADDPDRPDRPNLAPLIVACPSCEKSVSEPNPSCRLDHRAPRKVDPKIKWVVHEYNGVEVSLGPLGLTAEEILADGYKLPEDFERKPITEEDAIQVGSVILCPGLMGGFHVGTVERTAEGDWSFTTPGGGLWGGLEFGKDDRKAWVCSGVANLKALMKLELKR